MNHRPQRKTTSARWRRTGSPLSVALAMAAGLVALILVAALAVRSALAQEEGADESADDDAALRLIEQKPWDQLTLDAANNNAVLRIFPLESRVVPKSPAPTDKLRIRLIDNPSQEYDVQWKYIVRLRLYEQMVLEEAVALTAAGKSAEAWDNLAFLLEHYPKTEGLEKARQDYLYAEAGRLFQQQRYDATLGVLEELHRLAPNYSAGGGRDLSAILSQVIDKLAEGFFDSGDYFATRRLLSRIEAKFAATQRPIVAKWQQELQRTAQERSQVARELFAAEDFLRARSVSREVLTIWPTLPGAEELVVEIEARFPVIVVGVSQQADAGNPRSFDDWAARRVGRLTSRRLVEFEGHRPDGGLYATPAGRLSLSDDRQQMTFALDAEPKDAPPVDSFELSRRLLQLADRGAPHYDPLLGHLIDSVEVDDVDRVRLNLRQPHVLPQALIDLPLTSPPSGSGAAEPDGAYVFSSRSIGEVRFKPNPRFGSEGSYGILENHFTDLSNLSRALQSGEIDVVDRLLPADAVRLKSKPEIVVQPYTLPTICWLIPNPRNPFTANATFRRALVYGIDREGILRRNLLEGGEIEGCRIVSGPFPPGITGTDSWAYAYDSQIEARPYEPRLAITLVELARRETAQLAQKRGYPAPKLQPLTLVHPPEPLARLTCEAIAQRLMLIGVECNLKTLLPGQTADPAGNWDLMYMEAAMWEPFVDARRLLSIPAVDQLRGDYVRMSQIRLELARNEAEGRRRLRELHLLMHHEVTVVPLWQLVNHFAYRRTIKGIPENTLYLYDRVNDWRRETDRAVAAK